jgi:hypothetical protein
MDDFRDLKQQVEAMNAKTAPITKLQRDIFYFEEDLRASEVKLAFNVLLSDLDPENADAVFGPHNYTRRQYSLDWNIYNNKFHILLTNVTANKSKLLKDCSEELQQMSKSLFPIFIEKMAAVGKDIDETNDVEP